MYTVEFSSGEREYTGEIYTGEFLSEERVYTGEIIRGSLPRRNFRKDIFLWWSLTRGNLLPSIFS